MQVADILEYLDTLYPQNTACDFDNVGLLVGDRFATVKNVLVALDCTHQAVKSAISQDCNLIITHHPIIFEPLKTVTKGSVVYELIKNQISVISVHTNLDIGDGGVNDCLCKTIGLENVNKFTSSDGFLLREGIINPLSADDFAKHLKTVLGTNVRYVDGDKKINKVLVCSGSGGEFITEAISYDYDALVTSEVKHHQFLLAADNSVSLFDAGHFYTEDIVIEPLKDLLKSKFIDTSFFTYHDFSIKSV